MRCNFIKLVKNLFVNKIYKFVLFKAIQHLLNNMVTIVILNQVNNIILQTIKEPINTLPIQSYLKNSLNSSCSMNIWANHKSYRLDFIQNLLELLIVTCFSKSLAHIVSWRVFQKFVKVNDDVIKDRSHKIWVIPVKLDLKGSAPLWILRFWETCLNKLLFFFFS